MKKVIIAAIMAASTGSYAQLGGLLNKAKDKMSGKGGKVELFEEEKITAAAYQGNIGKVVFSNDDIERDLPESKYIKTYNFGDKLFIRAWTANSPANSMLLQLAESGVKPKEINEGRSSFDGPQTRVLYILYLDGVKVTNTSYAQNFNAGDMVKVPSVRADLNDGTEEINFGESLYVDLKRKQDLLTPGTHKLKLELVPFKTFGLGANITFKPIAAGEIDMIVKNTPINPNDPEACMPKAKMTDKALEAKILAAYKKKNYGDTPKEVRITSDKWTIVRHQYTGVPLRRFVEATIGKTKDGKCSYDKYDFNQDYDGTAYQSEVYLAGEGIGTERGISCKCFKP